MMQTLLQRLKSLTGPDREVSDLVLLSWGWQRKAVDGLFDDSIIMWRNTKITAFKEWSAFPPHPTASIDDALLGVPEHFERKMIKTNALQYTRGKKFAFECREPSEFGWSQGPQVFSGTHDIEPIAICIAVDAIVKARGGV